MGQWDRALDAAGVHDAGLREDYTRQRAVVAGYRRSAYLAARLLLPRPLLPHLVAAVAFMHRADTLLDSGPQEGRAAAYARWEKEVREGLDSGVSDHPEVRPLLNTVAACPGLRERVEGFLAAAVTELEFTSFATEADYQRYVDDYALPAFLLIAAVFTGEALPVEHLAAYRAYIDGSQRLDFANDLREDLDEGRLNIVQETLDAYGVTRTDLEQARDTPGTRAMVDHVLGQARHALAESRPSADLAPAAGRPLFRAMIEMEDLTAVAAEAKGTALLRGPARPPLPAAARMLARQYRHARRTATAAAAPTAR